MTVQVKNKDLWTYLDKWSESMDHWYSKPPYSDNWIAHAFIYWYGVNRDKWPDRNKEDNINPVLIQLCAKSLIFGPENFRNCDTKRGLRLNENDL